MTRQPPFTPEELTLLEDSGRARTWERGEVLMFEGDRADDVVLITDGLVRITKDSENGYTSVLAVRGPDDLLGELSCLDGGARSATATATSPGSGVTITADRFRALLTEHGSLALAVLRGVTARLRDSDLIRAEHGAYPSGVRVARALVAMARRHGVPTPEPPGAVVVLTNQRELAGAAGTSRESVARALRAMHRDGLIVPGRGRTLVTDPAGLGGWNGE